MAFLCELLLLPLLFFSETCLLPFTVYIPHSHFKIYTSAFKSISKLATELNSHAESCENIFSKSVFELQMYKSCLQAVGFVLSSTQRTIPGKIYSGFVEAKQLSFVITQNDNKATAGRIIQILCFLSRGL